MNLEESKVLMNIEKYGNTTSATLPCYDFEHLFKKGDTIILQHLEEDSWGSIYLKWAYDKQ
jgi:3-oxoacyl-[acyl-carrier-protein] synthase-3